MVSLDVIETLLADCSDSASSRLDSLDGDTCTRLPFRSASCCRHLLSDTPNTWHFPPPPPPPSSPIVSTVTHSVQKRVASTCIGPPRRATQCTQWETESHWHKLGHSIGTGDGWVSAGWVDPSRHAATRVGGVGRPGKLLTFRCTIWPGAGAGERFESTPQKISFFCLEMTWHTF